MKITRKYLQIAVILILIFNIQITAFAEVEGEGVAAPNPSTPIEEEVTDWDLRTDEEKFEYCTRVGIAGDENCRAIYNETFGCYYRNEDDREFDTFSEDCKVAGNAELCRRDRANKISACLSIDGMVRTTCEEQYICRSGATALDRNTEGGIPYDSEYFNINDPNGGGLVAPNQKTFDTNANGGPIIGTINEVINLLVSLIGIFALLVFIVGAVFLITANGDDNKIQKGKGAIKYALIGLVFVMMSYTIVILIQSILF